MIDRRTCFVLMPFGQPFDDYYKDLFVPAIERANMKAVRADDIFAPGRIIEQIWRALQSSDICLAELTGLNPNVLYELGLAHAIGKPVISVSQSVAELPFDLRHLRQVTYDVKRTGWETRLQEAIAKALAETLENPVQALALSPAVEPPANQQGTLRTLPGATAPLASGVMPAKPAPTGMLLLRRGCNNISPTVSESAVDFAARIMPATAVVAVWEHKPGNPIADPPSVGYLGWTPVAGAPNDLQRVTRLRPVFVCVSADATLDQPPG